MIYALVLRKATRNRCYSPYPYTMPARGQISMPMDERFWSKVDKRGPKDCWPWKRNTHRLGYGVFKVDRQRGNTGAHRVAFFLTHGRWPEPCCLHSCDNPPCCNPAHLREGTHADNMQDRLDRGRANLSVGESHGSAKLREADIAEIRSQRAKGWKLADIAAHHGVNTATIGRILQGKAWRTTPGPAPVIRRAGEPKRGEEHPGSVVTESIVREIRRLAASGISRAELHDRFGLSKSQVQRIVTGASWSHVR